MEKWKQDLIDQGEAELCPECKGVPKPPHAGGGTQFGPDLTCPRCSGQLVVRTKARKEKDELVAKKEPTELTNQKD